MNVLDDIKRNFNQLRPYEEKYFLRYIPLADQISLSDCRYILRYRVIFVLYLFSCRWRLKFWN